jgi:hypothetical protein
MHQHLTIADDQQRRDMEPTRRTGAPVVSVGEKDHYNPASPSDAAEYRLVRSYSHS